MPPLARLPRRRPTNPRKSPCPPLRPLRRPALSPRHPRLPSSRQTLARMLPPPLRNARSFPPSRRRSPAPPIHSRRPKRLSGAASPFPPRALSLLSFPPTSPRRILRLRADLSPAGRRPLQSGSPSPIFPRFSHSCSACRKHFFSSKPAFFDRNESLPPTSDVTPPPRHQLVPADPSLDRELRLVDQRRIFLDPANVALWFSLLFLPT